MQPYLKTNSCEEFYETESLPCDISESQKTKFTFFTKHFEGLGGKPHRKVFANFGVFSLLILLLKNID